MITRDIFLENFSDPLFQKAFRQYFSELGISVRNWDGLFEEMNHSPDTHAFLRLDENDSVIGFIQFSGTSLSNWFFELPVGFIREFWVAGGHRSEGHGSGLLGLAEKYFIGRNIRTIILTTDTASDFYLRRGFVRAPDIRAKNQDEVFVKKLK